MTSTSQLCSLSNVMMLKHDSSFCQRLSCLVYSVISNSFRRYWTQALLSFFSDNFCCGTILFSLLLLLLPRLFCRLLLLPCFVNKNPSWKLSLSCFSKQKLKGPVGFKGLFMCLICFYFGQGYVYKTNPRRVPWINVKRVDPFANISNQGMFLSKFHFRS